MPVKLLLLSEATMADVAGGIQKAIATEIQELRRRGYDIRLLVRQHQAGGPLEEVIDGVPILRLPSPVKGSRAFYLHPFNTMKRGPGAIEALHLTWPFDIALAHSTFWANALGRAKVPARKLFCFHAPAGDEIAIDIGRGKYGPLTPLAKAAVRRIVAAEERAIGLSDATFTRSSFMRERLRAIHPRHQFDVVPVVPLMVDTDHFKYAPECVDARARLDLPLDRPIVLCVRRLVARMGFEELIKAMAQVRLTRPDVMLLIGGRGYLEDELKALVQEQGLCDSIRFLGFIPDADLSTYYAAADLFVLPTSELEGFGMVTLEAASVGRLVVATPVGGNLEVIPSFDRALLTPGKDATALANGILDWLDRSRDAQRRASMRERCVELYSCRAVGERFEAVLRGEPAESAAVGADSLPTVSVVLPMRNEAAYIRPCLDSILANDYPADQMEVLVVDGNSTDESPDIVREYGIRDPRVRLVPNPNQTSAWAVNTGLQAARGEIVVRIDAHAEYARDYVSKSVAALLAFPQAGGAAGLQSAAGHGYLQAAIAGAMASPFGSGFAAYRKSQRPTWADTIYLGAWRRTVALGVGGFDTAWKINEDYEFNIRLRRAGYGLYLSPEIRSTYYPRASLFALARQYFRYGLWRVRTIYAYPQEVKWRQLAAPAFLLCLFAFAVLTPWTSAPLLALIGLYLLATALASLHTAAGAKWSYATVLPLVFSAMHLAWGAGFLVGVLRWLPQASALRRSKSQTAPSVAFDAPNKSGAS